MFDETFFKFATGFFGIILASFAITVILDHYAAQQTATAGNGASVFTSLVARFNPDAFHNN